MRRVAALAAAAVLSTVVSVVVFAPPAQAVPGITLGKSGPSSVLADGVASFSLTVGNPATNPTAAPEYNVSFRDVLPLGLAYVPGSTTPTSAGDPKVVTDTLTGQQTLIWSNVGDLQIGDSFALGFRADTNPLVLPVGATFSNTGSTYANTDPRRVPSFSSTGTPTPGSFTETATASTSPTLVSALRVTKSEPSPEGELLRGVHDHPSTYTVTVTNTDVSTTGSVVLTDYLPAELEFLGCGDVDNSSGPEYTGAPSLDATPVVPACVDPTSVTTVTNPPAQGGTTYPAGIYTRLQWDIGTMAPGAVITRPYAAGIPLRRNTATFPPTSSPDATANLDNNTGASTRELAAEQAATNVARAAGVYTGPVVVGGSTATSADTRESVTIEDVRMRKAASSGSFATLGRVQYTITIDTSEYVSADSIVLSDVIPNGMCPLGAAGANYVPGTPVDCTGIGALEPSVRVGAGPATPLPFDTVTLAPDGSFRVVFTPLPTGVGTNGTAVVTYSAGMRDVFTGGPNAGDPTSSGDTFTNTVSFTAVTTPRPGTGESGTQAVTDSSSASLGTDSLSIDKTIGPRSAFPTGSGPLCGTDGVGYGEPSAFPPGDTQFRKGDIICFKLRVDFPATTRTRNPVVTDFLPVGTEYIDGSAVATSNNVLADATLVPSPEGLTWTVGDAVGTGRYPGLNAVFEWVFAVRVTDAAPLGAPDLLGNAMKLRAEDSSGRGRSYRDQVDFSLRPAVPIGILKGIAAIDSPAAGPNGVNSNVDGLAVREGSRVTFRIDVTNKAVVGAIDAYGAGSFDIWDVLPENITCADISNIVSLSGNPVPNTIACTNPGQSGHPTFAGNDKRSAIRIKENQDPTLLPLASQGIVPGQTWSYTYDMVIPSPTSQGIRFTNTAAIRSFSALTNVPTSRPDQATATYFPRNNIDTTVPVADQDAPPATDDSNVVTPTVWVGKTGVTSIDQTNNNLANQATVGELITYRYAVTVPAGTAIFDGSLTDTLPLGLVLEASPAPTVEFCPVAPTPPALPTRDPLLPCAVPGTVPGNVSVDPTTGALTVSGTFDNPTAFPQRFLVTSTVRVTTGALTPAQNAITRTNTVSFVSTETLGGSGLTPVTAQYPVNIRQPLPTIVKINDKPGVVVGGDTVTYTVSVFNRNSASSTTNRPPLHDAFVVDCLPSGLTFGAYGANPGLTPVPGTGSNGCAIGTTRLVWSLGTVAPSTSGVTRNYTATVNLAAVGGDSYTNTARLTGSTLADGKPAFDAPDNPNERVYSVTDPSTVTVAGSGIVKVVDEPLRTIGQTATFTIVTTIPVNTNFYEATLLDQVPAGFSAPANVTYECVDIVTTLPCGNAGTALTPTVQPDGSTMFGFTVGDFTASPNLRRETVTYTSTLLDVASNTAGKPLTNTAQTAWFSTDGRTPVTNPAVFDRRGGIDTATVTVLEPSLSITKAVTDSTPDPGQTFRYTITVTNKSGAAVSDAFNTIVTDTVPAGVVVEFTTAGGVVAGADPVTGGGTITWPASELTGPLAPGESYSLTYFAHLAPSASIDSTPLVNVAKVTAYESLPSGGRPYVGPSVSAPVTPQFPLIDTAKVATSGTPAYIGAPFTWTVTATNAGGARTLNVSVADRLPPNWSYVAGSALVSVAGAPATQEEPIVIPNLVGAADSLFWLNQGSLRPGEQLTVTYTAVPDPDVVADPGVGAAVPHTNTAVSLGEDATGAAGNSAGSYGGATGQASTRIDSADVRIIKSHKGSPVAGSTFDWTLTVSNLGPDTAVGPFTVTDTIVAPAVFSSASGTGWSCSALGADVTCVRTNAANTLASGASFPPITVRVSVPAGTLEGTTLTNAAGVSAKTYDPQLANNTSTDTAAVITRADLAITKNHTGTVLAGQDATYTVDVVNRGPSVSRGPITVVDTLPTGTTFVPAAPGGNGAGWVCTPDTPAAGQVSCVRAADLGVGIAAPQLVLTMAIPSGQTAAVVNTATVTGTTTDPVPGNNTDDDRATPSTSADLAIQKANVGSVVAGTTATYRLTVDNAGPSDAASPVRITDTLPTGLSYAGTFRDITGTWACSAALQVVTCELSGPLAADPDGLVSGDAVVEIDVTVASEVTGTIANTATVGSPTTDPNLVNNTDTESTSFVGEADLEIIKSHTGQATAGSPFSWLLQVTNKGPSDSPGDIVVTDALPAGTTFVSATGTDWACSAVGQLVTCRRTATLVSAVTDPVAAAAPPITVTVRVDPSAGPGVMTNLASVDGPVTDPVPGNNLDSDVVTIIDSAEISLTKATTGADPVAAGDTTDFTLTVTNAGPSTADSVVVTDTMPAGLVPVSASGAGWTCAAPVGALVSCSRDSLAPSASTILVEARVASWVVDGTTLTNSATVSTSTPGDTTPNNTDTSTVAVIARADLVLVKGHAPAYDEVPAGQQAEFTLDVSNAGPSDAQPDITLVDTLPAGLTFVSATGPWTCTPGASTGTGQVVTCAWDDAIVLPAGGALPRLAMRVLVDPTADAGTYTNSATATSPTTDPDPDNNTDIQNSIMVTRLADLSITKAHTAAARVGDDLDFTLAVVNAGPSQARSVVVADTIPDGLTFVAAAGTGWTCAEAAGTLTCDLTGPLAPGATAEPIVVTVTVEPGAYPSVTNTASVGSDARDPNTADNTDSDVVGVPPLVDLAITKSHTDTFQVGSPATYTLTVSNAGPTADAGPITVTDTLPAGLSFVSGIGDGWTCSSAAATVTCVRPGTLGVAEVTSLGLVVDVLPAAFPTVVNTATVSTPSEETSVENNTASDPADVAPLVELGLVKALGSFDTAELRATWIIAVTNNGPNSSQRPIVVTDVLPTGLAYVSSTGTGWTCSASGQTVTCVSSGDLPVGGTTAFEILTAVTGEGDEVIVNEASISGNVDPNPDNDRSSAELQLPSDDTLPRTGADAAALALLGLLALMLGGVALGTTRRRPGRTG